MLMPKTAKVNRRLGLHRQTGKGARRGLFRVKSDRFAKVAKCPFHDCEVVEWPSQRGNWRDQTDAPGQSRRVAHCGWMSALPPIATASADGRTVAPARVLCPQTTPRQLAARSLSSGSALATALPLSQQ